jgi:hypothetical protein
MSPSSIDDYSHRKRAGAHHHHHRGKHFYGRDKARAIRDTIAKSDVDPDYHTYSHQHHTPISSRIIVGYVETRNVNFNDWFTPRSHTHDHRHPLKSAIAQSRIDRTRRENKKEVIRYSHHSRRNDVRSQLSHGHIHGSQSYPYHIHRGYRTQMNMSRWYKVRKNGGGGFHSGESSIV